MAYVHENYSDLRTQFKNITVRQIALLLTGFLSFLFILAFNMLIFLDDIFGHRVINILIVAGTALLACFFLVRYVLERFVFRKIKLIYKIINESKRNPNMDNKVFNIDEFSIESVNEEVAEWAKKKESEIAYLTDLEDYRRSYLGNISHELKTPIFSIQGYLHTLKEGGLYDETVNMKYLDRALSNLDRLEDIVMDLETINKLESGAEELSIETFDIKELALDTMKDLEVMADQKNISFKLKEGATKSFNVKADREKIRQVFTNLFSNSIKYGSEQGGLTKVGFYDMADKVLIEVSDNGVGIDGDHIKHLFDRFYRVDKSGSRHRGGAGLGLAIVKHIIEAHQQNINVRSTPGIGSTFGFTLKKKG